METRAHHILIGLFVLLACVGAMLFGLWLSKSQSSDDTRHYQVVFTESVRGLSVGSPVEYNGIAVGDVLALDFDPANPSRVLARIRVHGNTLVRQDTTATLAMQGLTGRASIQLSGGAGDSPVLRSDNGQDPVILAQTSSVARVLDQGENMVANLNALALSAREFLSPENAAHLQQTLSNLAHMSATLASQSGDVGETLRDVRTAVRQLTQTFADVRTLAQTLQTPVDAHAPRIASNLDRSAAALADILQQTDTLLRDGQGSLRSTLQGASALGPTLNELRATLAALRTTLERLNQDPAGYLLNRSPLPEFTP